MAESQGRHLTGFNDLPSHSGGPSKHPSSIRSPSSDYSVPVTGRVVPASPRDLLYLEGGGNSPSSTKRPNPELPWAPRALQQPQKASRHLCRPQRWLFDPWGGQGHPCHAQGPPLPPNPRLHPQPRHELLHSLPISQPATIHIHFHCPPPCESAGEGGD